MKLVAEPYPFGPGRRLVEVLTILFPPRSYAVSRDSSVECVLPVNVGLQGKDAFRRTSYENAYGVARNFRAPIGCHAMPGSSFALRSSDPRCHKYPSLGRLPSFFRSAVCSEQGVQVALPS